MGVESRTRRLLDQIEDLPDWVYMKAVELSRALDESDLSPESVAVTLLLLNLSLERRLQALETLCMENTNEVNNWIEYFGELLPVDPEVWDTGEEDDEEEEENE